MKNVSPALEDYLETIYFLSSAGDGVRVTDVAAEMAISKPSVNKAINILKERGYVEHEHYGSLSLTDEGARVAKGVAAQHHAVKRLLIRISIRNLEMKGNCPEGRLPYRAHCQRRNGLQNKGLPKSGCGFYSLICSSPSPNISSTCWSLRE